MAASTIFVINSTIAGNTANNGGGVAGPGGHLTLKNTIVASNTGGNCSSNGPNSAGHNLSDDTSCSPFFTAVGDLNNTPAQLAPNGLQSNGSIVTKTIALLFTSPAINAIPISPTNFCTAIDGTTPLATDQRGILRPQDFACDIGAFELDMDTDRGLAILSGSNTFTGNQTVNGTLAATAVTGNGSGLTAISPANISPGTAAINITGAAASATNATNAVNATTAGNALNLGGVAAAQYARLDIGNSFNGDQSVTGNVSGSGNLRVGGTTTMGGGTPIVEHLSATFNPSFPALKPSACATASFAFTGTSDGDTVALGVPNARMGGGGTIEYAAWVNAANTITIRACNIDPNVKQTTAGVGTIRVDLWKH